MATREARAPRAVAPEQERSQHSEKPVCCNEEHALRCATREKPSQQQRPRAAINKQIKTKALGPILLLRGGDWS